MGYGDEIMGSGVARGAATRGRRIAFGDGNKIIWHKHAAEIFWNNPNVAPPGSEDAPDLEWVEHYPGRRLYHRGRENGTWLYSDWRATPGELFLSGRERAEAAAACPPFDLVVEPNVKSIAPNKSWGWSRYDTVVLNLQLRHGLRVVQFAPNADWPVLPKVRRIITPTFRRAMAVLARARMFLGPEGGLHHAAAALGVPGVVIFGGFTHPRNTGYDLHRNIFVGDEPCGRQAPCLHCKAAMDAIAVDRVIAEVEEVWRSCPTKPAGTPPRSADTSAQARPPSGSTTSGSSRSTSST